MTCSNCIQTSLAFQPLNSPLMLTVHCYRNVIDFRMLLVDSEESQMAKGEDV